MAIRLELNHLAIEMLLKSTEVQENLKVRAEAIATAAGNDVTVEGPLVGRTRARVSVRAESFEARAAESKYKVLTRALDAGR